MNQISESDRKSRCKAIMRFNGADQSGSATATSTRSRKNTRSEPITVVTQRVIVDINTAVREDAQKKQLKATADAAPKDSDLADEENPLYCRICTNIQISETKMRGFECRDPVHDICFKCWVKCRICPLCRKPRFYPQ